MDDWIRLSGFWFRAERDELIEVPLFFLKGIHGLQMQKSKTKTNISWESKGTPPKATPQEIRPY